MTQRDIGALALRLVAVLTVPWAVLALGDVFSLLARWQQLSATSETGPGMLLLSSLLPAVLLLVFVRILWIFGDPIARHVVRKPEQPAGIDLHLQPIAIVTLALLVLGVFLVAEALPGCVQHSLAASHQWRTFAGQGHLAVTSNPLLLGVLPMLLSSLIKLAVGCLLVFAPGRLVKFLFARIPDFDDVIVEEW